MRGRDRARPGQRFGGVRPGRTSAGRLGRCGGSGTRRRPSRAAAPTPTGGRRSSPAPTRAAGPRRPRSASRSSSRRRWPADPPRPRGRAGRGGRRPAPPTRHARRLASIARACSTPTVWVQGHGPTAQPRADELGGLTREPRRRRLRQCRSAQERPRQGREPIERRWRPRRLRLADVRPRRARGPPTRAAVALVGHRLRQPQDILKPVRGRAPVPGLEAGRADARQPLGRGLGGGQAHDGLTSWGVGVMALGEAGWTVSPASRRKREGGRKTTSPQRRRMRATESTSRSRARVIPT